MDDGKIEELSDLDKEILRLKYTNRKLSYKQIGQLLPKPLSLQAVHQRLNKPQMKKHWALLEEDIIWQIKNAQKKALIVILNTLNSRDPKLAFQAAKTILEPILANCPDLLPERVESIMGLEFYETKEKDAQTPTDQETETTET